jgi:hypothetical protein
MNWFKYRTSSSLVIYNPYSSVWILVLKAHFIQD